MGAGIDTAGMLKKVKRIKRGKQIYRRLMKGVGAGWMAVSEVRIIGELANRCILPLAFLDVKAGPKGRREGTQIHSG
jgi:hypothetical protein